MKKVNINQPYAVYEALKNVLNKHRIDYREVEHAAEGRSEQSAEILGHETKEGAKAMVVDTLSSENVHQYYLAILPSDKRVNLEAIKEFTKANKVSLAKTKIMKRLTNCDAGAVPPFSFDENLNIVVDPSLYENNQIVFNAGRLDRTIFMSAQDYRKVIKSEYQGKPSVIELDISQVEATSKEVREVESSQEVPPISFPPKK